KLTLSSSLLSDSSSSSSSSSPSALVIEDDDDEGFSQPVPIKTRDEVLPEELPAVEEVSVSLPEDVELQPVGTVSSIIQQLVVIQSLRDTPALIDDSIIFTSDRQAVGKVFEVFGPVSSPLYILRLNSVEQISSKGLKEGLTVYYAPAIKEYTGYILTQQLKLIKPIRNNKMDKTQKLATNILMLFQLSSKGHKNTSCLKHFNRGYVFNNLVWPPKDDLKIEMALDRKKVPHPCARAKCLACADPLALTICHDLHKNTCTLSKGHGRSCLPLISSTVSAPIV
uniref:H/ACA ribonucleoprotein complex subunit n=1 Tax=Scophthalmus maximus TaxID=52904 RepID=A0A8D3DBB7_SCOMX